MDFNDNITLLLCTSISMKESIQSYKTIYNFFTFYLLSVPFYKLNLPNDTKFWQDLNQILAIEICNGEYLCY